MLVTEQESSSEVEVEQEKPSKEEALAPFLKFFKGRSDSREGVEEDSKGLEVSEENEEGDKKVNVVDLVRLKKMIALENETSAGSGDLDASGEVDSGDLVVLVKILLKSIII